MRTAKAEAQRIMAEANAKIENTIREIKEAQAEKERTRMARKALDEFKESVLSQEDANDSIAIKMAKLKERQEKKNRSKLVSRLPNRNLTGK